MSQVALAWLYAKGVTAPIVGATKAKYFAEAAKTLEIKLDKDDIEALEAPYLPHKVVGALSH